MPDFSLATGLNLMSADGILPPNLARQALAFTSPAQSTKLDGDGYASQRVATMLAMEANQPAASVELSPEAMQFLVNDLATPAHSADAPSHAAPAPQAAQSTSYSYGGSPQPAALVQAAAAAQMTVSPSINVLG